MVTHQLQIRCRPVKVRRSETDVLPLSRRSTTEPPNQVNRQHDSQQCNYRPSSEGNASGRWGSLRPAAEDRRCDTQTDNCRSTATRRRPCTPDRTPCGHRLPSPEVHSPPCVTQHQYLQNARLLATVKPGFYYPSSRAKLTARELECIF